jgi:pimeloyl-ACP methyl ester carboxylesterase
MALALALLGTSFLTWQRTLLGREKQTVDAEKETVGKFSEELVYVQSKDDITNAGAIFAPPKESAKPIAVLWIHGWGSNFYFPTYVKIGRALAERGYTCITANTRMHDIGTKAGWRGEKPIFGGRYWGLISQEPQDLAAWIDFAIARGYKGVVLAGHSAGTVAVRTYQAQKQDQRVVGIVYASGAIRTGTFSPDPELLAQARRLVADGRGDYLLSVPNRPACESAATYLDLAKIYSEQRDFFGVETPKAPVSRIRCPILAWFGTKEPDVGTAADLELLKSSLKRQESGPSRVDTAMIRGADHDYRGEEAQVAQTIAKWADTLVPPEAGKNQ